MIHIPIWSIFLVISILSIWWALTRELQGDYDFITPLISTTIILMNIVFWCAWGLRGFIK